MIKISIKMHKPKNYGEKTLRKNEFLRLLAPYTKRKILLGVSTHR